MRAVYVPKQASLAEVEKALDGYIEVPFTVLDGRVIASEETERDGSHWEITDYSGQDSLLMMPGLANRPECLACFFIADSPDSELFYQTAEYARLYGDDMSLKSLYFIRR